MAEIDPSRSLTFQVYRINLQGATVAELQGPRLEEFVRKGSFVSGEDTVDQVKQKLRQVMQTQIQDGENIAIWFGGRSMQEDSLFYADNFICLPAWFQVLIHAGTVEALQDHIRNLSAK